jgi:hypothetical protein
MNSLRVEKQENCHGELDTASDKIEELQDPEASSG